MSVFRIAAAAVGLSVAAGCVSTDLPSDSRIEKLIASAAQVEGAPPAYAVIAVDGPRTTIAVAGTQGPSDAQTPADRRTRFYVASVTKSYVGLLAAELDRRKILQLDARLSDLWPELALPAQAEGRAITLRDLLSHSSRLNNSALNFRAANIGALDDDTFAEVFRSGTVWTDREFQYTNFGYLVYAQVLRRVTGRSWQDWLESAVLEPLGLDETSPDPAAAPLSKMAYGAQLGPDGWVRLSPKPRDTMHAAGGLYASAKDAERWLRANLAMSGLPAASFTAQRRKNAQTQVNMPGRACSGYALGLMICTIGDLPVYGHLGTFAGWRATMSFAPDAQRGVYVVAGSDHSAQMWALALESLIYDVMADRHDAARETQMLGMFERAAAEFRAERTEDRERALAEIASSAWRPDETERAGYAGLYRSPTLGDLCIAAKGNELAFSAGAHEARLLPVARGAFVAMSEGVEVERVRIEGGVFHWGDDRFKRAADDCGGA